ncbi:MAG: transposase [Bacteroidales bacterium]|nr:transposase [Bacteroidales bacterium]
MNNKEEIHNHCRNYLPHIENKRYQMITFRLYDSVPREVIERWKREVDDGVRASSPPNFPNFLNPPTQRAGSPHSKLVLIDKYEDSGAGQCFMRDDREAQIVKDTLFYYDGDKYNIIAWCIMPNHVHILIMLLKAVSLSEIIHSWKSYSAKQINKLLNRKGQVWMMEYFDRFIRDSDHYEKVVNYIHNNPVKAGLVTSPSEYRWCSAFEKRH